MFLSYYFIVLSARLSKGRVKYDRKLSLNIKEIVKQRLELRCKNCSTVINYSIWKAVILYYHVDDYF